MTVNRAARARASAPATKAPPAEAAAPEGEAAPAKKNSSAPRRRKPTSSSATADTPNGLAATTDTPNGSAATGRSRRTAPPGVLAVRGDEEPWTEQELAGVRADLEGDVARLRTEISVAETDLAGLMRDAGDGAGDDQADAGAKTFEREQEISLADNQREMLEQSEHALERIADGTYGRCESCGNPIGKLRLQAFPRATLCVPCKQKQERR